MTKDTSHHSNPNEPPNQPRMTIFRGTIGWSMHIEGVTVARIEMPECGDPVVRIYAQTKDELGIRRNVELSFPLRDWHDIEDAISSGQDVPPPGAKNPPSPPHHPG